MTSDNRSELEALAQVYGAGYSAGHDDTVEGRYTDVMIHDRYEYFASVALECFEYSGGRPASAQQGGDAGWSFDLAAELQRLDSMAGAIGGTPEIGECYDRAALALVSKMRRDKGRWQVQRTGSRGEGGDA